MTAAGFGNGYDGIAIDSAPGTTIGGSVAAARNIISNNTTNGGEGILVGNFEESNGAYGTVIQGNYIGTDITGALARGNNVGIDIEGQSGVLVGTRGLDGAADSLEGNLVSGNLTAGIRVNATSSGPRGAQLPGATGEVIAGNYIGTNYTGTAALGNGGDGVQLEGGVTNTWVGTAYGPQVADERNVISGNAGYGVELSARARRAISWRGITSEQTSQRRPRWATGAPA